MLAVRGTWLRLWLPSCVCVCVWRPCCSWPSTFALGSDVLLRDLLALAPQLERLTVDGTPVHGMGLPADPQPAPGFASGLGLGELHAAPLQRLTRLELDASCLMKSRFRCLAQLRRLEALTLSGVWLRGPRVCAWVSREGQGCGAGVAALSGAGSGTECLGVCRWLARHGGSQGGVGPNCTVAGLSLGGATPPFCIPHMPSHVYSCHARGGPSRAPALPLPLAQA